MKTYYVGMWETIGWYSEIEANSKEEAEKKARAILDEQGIEGFKGNTDITHREVDTCDCKQI